MSMRRASSGIALALLALGVSLAGAPAWGEVAAAEKGKGSAAPSAFAARVDLGIAYPPPGSVVGTSPCGTFFAGYAGELRRTDLMLVIDTSRSTIEPAGADLNGNGIIGRPYPRRLGSLTELGSTDPQDSILAAEVAASREVLLGLDPRTTRLGVITFAGRRASRVGFLSHAAPPSATTVVPLTDDYTDVQRALDEILRSDPEGGTDMAAGVELATTELTGGDGARSIADTGSQKVVLFFTDGQPTLPRGPSFEADNVRAVLRATNRARSEDVRIHSFAIGAEALAGPLAVLEMAQRTDGLFTPVPHAGNLVQLMGDVRYDHLELLSLKNVTTGDAAERFRSGFDGSWSGFVRMQPGPNQIELRARAADGTERRQIVEVAVQDGSPSPPVPEHLAGVRHQLLEECLADARKARESAEQELVERVRKQLMTEIENARSRARLRANEQRKRLQIETDVDE